MFTRDDLQDRIKRNSNDIFIDILLEFMNNFYKTFKILNKQELLKRINKLEYIGYEDISRGYICNSDKACFGQGFYYYIAVNRDVIDYSELKACLYHELIHCLSIHRERSNIVSGYKNPDLYRPLFDEIITEFYAHTLLSQEGINYNNRFIHDENIDYKLVSTYNGCGYHEYMGLGKLYDYVFNRNLLYGKFINTASLRNEINDLIYNYNLDMTYDSFINNDDPIRRYIDVTKLFLYKLIDTYNHNCNYNYEIINKDKHINEYLDLGLKEETPYYIKPYSELEELIVYELDKYNYNKSLYKEY